MNILFIICLVIWGGCTLLKGLKLPFRKKEKGSYAAQGLMPKIGRWLNKATPFYTFSQFKLFLYKKIQYATQAEKIVKHHIFIN